MPNQTKSQYSRSFYPFQVEGASWLARRTTALLADEMGLGKSAQCILAADMIGAKRVLIICPAVARINWTREFDQWSFFERPLVAVESYGDVPSPSESASCSFEYATFNALSIASEKWDLLIIDEAHFLKSPDAKRTQAIFGRSGIVRAAKRVWALSGTPAPNHAGELWTLFYSFGVTELKHSAFIDRYCDVVVTGYGVKVVGTKKSAIPELKSMLARTMLRRRINDVLPDLPGISVHPPFVVKAGKVEGLDKEFRERLAKEEGLVSEIFSRREWSDEEKLRVLEGLATSVSTLRRYTGLQKVEPASELILLELEASLYEKIVVFAIHKEVVSKIRENLEENGVKCVVVNGETTDRQAQVDAFQNDKSVKVFIGNIHAAGTNITLTAAHQVLFVEQDWVPGNNSQAAMRCRRIGQKHHVSVRFIALSNPIDERVTRSLAKKTRELTEIFSD